MRDRIVRSFGSQSGVVASKRRPGRRPSFRSKSGKDYVGIVIIHIGRTRLTLLDATKLDIGP